MRKWFTWNSGNPLFDIIETIFYYDIPRFFGYDGNIAVQDGVVYKNYHLSTLEPAAREMYQEGKHIALIEESTKHKESLYLYMVGTREMTLNEVVETVYKYYAPQQILRVIFTRVAEKELRILDIPLWTITVDRPMEMHSGIPAHRTATKVGYNKYYRNFFEARVKGVSDEFLEHIKGLSWDYALAAVKAAHLMAWAQYFAETEDTYVFGALRRARIEHNIKEATLEPLEMFKDTIPAPVLDGNRIVWKKVKRKIQIE